MLTGNLNHVRSYKMPPALSYITIREPVSVDPLMFKSWQQETMNSCQRGEGWNFYFGIVVKGNLHVFSFGESLCSWKTFSPLVKYSSGFIFIFEDIYVEKQTMCINKHLKAFALFSRNLLTCPKCKSSIQGSCETAEMVCACRTPPFPPPVPRADLEHLGFPSCGTVRTLLSAELRAAMASGPSGQRVCLLPWCVLYTCLYTDILKDLIYLRTLVLTLPV